MKVLDLKGWYMRIDCCGLEAFEDDLVRNHQEFKVLIPEFLGEFEQ